jgi:hypothetical protein
MSLVEELEEFVRDHRQHGQHVAHATAPLPNGCLLTVVCPCGVTFFRWVTPLDAAEDRAAIARLN